MDHIVGRVLAGLVLMAAWPIVKVIAWWDERSLEAR